MRPWMEDVEDAGANCKLQKIANCKSVPLARRGLRDGNAGRVSVDG